MELARFLSDADDHVKARAVQTLAALTPTSVQVSLPAHRIVTEDNVKFFGIQVTADSASWEVKRRYSSFRAARDILPNSLLPDEPFPRKYRLWGCEGERLEARRLALVPERPPPREARAAREGLAAGPLEYESCS